MSGFQWILVLIAIFAVGDALHCFSHEQCGEHSVCISMGPGQTPKCMCLVGYNRNGVTCEKIDTSKSNATTAKLDQLILEKTGCSSIRKQFTGPPGFSPPGFGGQSVGSGSNEKRKTTPLKVEFSTDDEDAKVTERPSKGGIANTKACTKVVCNFDVDSCRYRSLGEVTWIRKPKKAFGNRTAPASDYVASIKPNKSIKDQFLASENFVLLEQAEFSFKYFESDLTPHIQVCDNDLAHCFWQSDGVNGKWTDAAVVLPSGTHRMIFVVSDVGPGKSVAIDDIRLESDGEQAVCV